MYIKVDGSSGFYTLAECRQSSGALQKKCKYVAINKTLDAVNQNANYG